MKKISDEQKAAHPEVVEMLNDLDKLASVKAIADMEGGQILLQSLVSDVVSSFDTLCAKYSTLSLQEFVGLCADMKTKVDLARVISRAKKNANELEKMIQETLQS